MKRSSFHLLLYWVYRVAATVARTLPLTWGFCLGRWAGLLGWLVAGKLRRLALENLRAAFGSTRSEREIQRIGRESFCRIGANLISSVKLAAMSSEAVMRRVDFQIPPAVEARRAVQRTGWVAMISHLGNWELYAQIRHFLPEFELGAVYQPLSNKLIDDEIRRDRARFGVRLFDRRSALVQASRFLREGGVVGILVDQYAGEAGVWTPFFGRLASTSPLAGTLAKHADVPIVPIAVYTTGLARWRVVVSELIELDDQDGDQLTARITQMLEQQIAGSPEDWLWAHDRWKTPFPGFLLSSMPRGVVLPKGEFEPLRPFRIAVIAPDDLIANVAAVRAVRAIRHGRPDAEVTVFALPEFEAVWNGCDEKVMVSTASFAGGGFDALFAFSDRTVAGLEAVPRVIRGSELGIGREQAWEEAAYLKVAGRAGAVPV